MLKIGDFSLEAFDERVPNESIVGGVSERKNEKRASKSLH